MSRLYWPLSGSEIYKNIINDTKRGRYPLVISGCVDSQKSHLIANVAGKHKCRLVLTYREEKAKEIYEDLKFFEEHVCYYPSKDVLFYSADIHSSSTTSQRIRALKEISLGQDLTIVAGIDVLLERMMPADIFRGSVITLEEGQVAEEAALRIKFTEMGYESTPMVEKPGDFAIRGSIVDVYPLTEETPYRIDLWGDEIDSIKTFDVDSQRQIDRVESITIYPASELILSRRQIREALELMDQEYQTRYKELQKDKKKEEAVRLRKTVERMKDELEAFGMSLGGESMLPYVYENTVSLLDYLPEDTIIFLDEPHRVKDRGESYTEEFEDSMKSRYEGGYLLKKQTQILYSYEDVLESLRDRQVILLSSVISSYDDFDPVKNYHIEAKSIYSYNNSFEQLLKDLDHWRTENYRMMLMSSSQTRAKRLAKDIADRDFLAYYSEDGERAVVPGEIMVTQGRLNSGFEYPGLKFVVLTEKDIFKNRKKRKRKKKSQHSGQAIRSITDISIGDYVVHEKYGIGIYRGLEKIESDGVVKDYINIEYKDASNLFIPASQLDVIEKYASSSARKPKINKLGGNEWERTKSRVRGQVKIAAKDLVDLYAQRQSMKGYEYGPDTVWQTEFEELFPYEETEDQLQAIEDTKTDMESTKIMDRLICGDVGYGKTEVAIRAAFKAVQESKQVAFLVPTTILAQQHYNSFKERMERFAVNIRMLSRFCSAKEEREIKKGLKEGSVDIVIGTHKLLAKSVVYKDLGLLIIDEEQRFGVKQKEKIKQIRKDVDVLALSATPIPRTLHMSLAGIRDMSVLEIPPVDRRAIQTYVMEYNPEMVREAIERELARSGQVYYVYNRTSDIDQVAANIRKLVPDARVEYAHGQMGERQLEDIMNAFINREIDVLVSTTIIETGLDISNANTMIIHDAQRYGLSQLYQLRGRVGRSNRTAYAFLMYQRNTILKEEAEKRLKAIREFTDLGSGFKIAMRDLEIRGAGNLLGAEQSGHMEAVGYDMYCKMLNDAVMEMKGTRRFEDTFETTIDLQIDAFIPSSYVASENQKLDLYRRIAQVENEEEADDMIDELVDRYGEPPAPVSRLLEVSILKSEAHSAFLTSIEQKGGKIRFIMSPRATRVRVDQIDPFVKQYRGKMKFETGTQPAFVLRSDQIAKKDILDKVREIVGSIKENLISEEEPVQI